ncbi:hypothetical protein ACFX2I_012275 [Malus domestica]
MACKEGNFVDVSCFFLFEGSADSEAADHQTTAPLRANNTNTAVVLLEDDKDAESCSSGTFGVCVHNYSKDRVKDQRPPQSWGRSMVWLQYSDGAAKGYEEEEVESKLVGVLGNMDEMEDSLFWKTCMAVGYP